MNEESKDTAEVTGETGSTITENPLLNPEMIRRVAAMLTSTQNAARESETNAEERSPQEKNASAEDALAAFLSDPTLLQRLPQIISVIKPLLGATFSAPDHPSAPSHTTKSKVEANRDQLLLSLKPFLSSARCEAIDTMLRIAHLGELFGQFR